MSNDITSIIFTAPEMKAGFTESIVLNQDVQHDGLVTVRSANAPSPTPAINPAFRVGPVSDVGGIISNITT